MLIRNPEKTISAVTCYKVNKYLADYLVMDKLLPMFAFDEKDKMGYYFIKNENSDNAINGISIFRKPFCRYEIVGREVKKIE